MRSANDWLFYLNALCTRHVALVSATKRGLGFLAQDQIRRRLQAAFVAAHFLVLFLLPAGNPIDLAFPLPDAWLRSLSLYNARSVGSLYAGLLLVGIAVLGAVQIPRPTPPGLPRWIWILGWINLTGSALLFALVDLSEIADIGLIVVGKEYGFSGLAVLAPLALLVLIPAGLVFWKAQIGHPARAFLAVVAVMLSFGSFVRDILTRFYAGAEWSREYLTNYLEEHWELIAVLIISLILVEVTLSMNRRASDVSNSEALDIGNLPLRSISMMAIVPLLLLSFYAANLHIESTSKVFEGKRFGGELPRSYTGPLSLVEQRFQVEQDNLSRIKVWSYIDGGFERDTATVFARLTTEGSDHPIRESQAVVTGGRFSNSSIVFEFEPIPDSGGKLYTLAIGVLGGPRPWVFLGLTDGGFNPNGAATISGQPSPFGDALTMVTYWTDRAFLTYMGGSDVDPRRLAFAADFAMTTFVWIFVTIAVGRGISGCQPRFWSRYVGGTLWSSVLMVSGIATLGMLLLPILLTGSPK